MGVPQLVVSRTGTDARVPAQLPEPLPGGGDAVFCLFARPHLLCAGGSVGAEGGRPGHTPDRLARAALPAHLLDTGARQSAGVVAGGAVARGDGRAVAEAPPG